MKQYFRLPFVLVFIIVLFASCGISELRPTVNADARIRVYVTPEDTLFGIGLYAVADANFSSVTVSYSGNDPEFYTLVPYNESEDDYYYETPLDEMTHTPPSEGAYDFDMEFESGEFGSISDNLTSEYVYPPHITLCEFNTDLNKIAIRWAEIIDEGILRIDIYNANHELLYQSPTVNKSQVIYTLGYNSQTWYSEAPPANGDQIIIEISFYIFEFQGNGAYDTQASATIRKSVTWGG